MVVVMRVVPTQDKFLEDLGKATWNSVQFMDLLAQQPDVMRHYKNPRVLKDVVTNALCAATGGMKQSGADKVDLEAWQSGMATMFEKAKEQSPEKTGALAAIQTELLNAATAVIQQSIRHQWSNNASRSGYFRSYVAVMVAFSIIF